MLVLSRTPGESVKIGPGVEVKIVEVRGDRVRLGITAPEDVRITRSEIEPVPGPRRLDPDELRAAASVG